MKKVFVMLAVGLMSISAFAQEEVSQEILQEQDAYASPGEVIGGVIGGILDGVTRDGRRGPGRPRAYVCYARNIRGQVFQARDWNINRAQRMAMRECQSRSFRCQPAGCRAY